MTALLLDLPISQPFLSYKMVYIPEWGIIKGAVQKSKPLWLEVCTLFPYSTRVDASQTGKCWLGVSVGWGGGVLIPHKFR